MIELEKDVRIKETYIQHDKNSWQFDYWLSFATHDRINNRFDLPISEKQFEELCEKNRIISVINEKIELSKDKKSYILYKMYVFFTNQIKIKNEMSVFTIKTMLKVIKKYKRAIVPQELISTQYFFEYSPLFPENEYKENFLKLELSKEQYDSLLAEGALKQVFASRTDLELQSELIVVIELYEFNPNFKKPKHWE